MIKVSSVQYSSVLYIIINRVIPLFRLRKKTNRSYCSPPPAEGVFLLLYIIFFICNSTCTLGSREGNQMSTVQVGGSHHYCCAVSTQYSIENSDWEKRQKISSQKPVGLIIACFAPHSRIVAPQLLMQSIKETHTIIIYNITSKLK